MWSSDKHVDFQYLCVILSWVSVTIKMKPGFILKKKKKPHTNKHTHTHTHTHTHKSCQSNIHEYFWKANKNWHVLKLNLEVEDIGPLQFGRDKTFRVFMVLIMETLDTMFLFFDFHGKVAVKSHTAGWKTTLLAAATVGNLNAHTWYRE